MTHSVGILCGDKIWKKAFSSAVLIIVACTFFLSSFTHVLAQNSADRPGDPGFVPPSGPVTTPPAPGGGTGGSDPTDFADGPTTDESVAAAQAAAASAAAAANLGSTPDGVLGLIHAYVFTGIGWVVGQAGSAFDYAIREYIVGFGRLYSSSTGETIDALWSTVRDIFNLTFIFGLVYIGFKMILDSSDSSARKMLISLIGAALLVNFSLFITKFVVDFSNIAATQVFNAFSSSGAELSITNGFMTLMGINSLIGVEYTTGGSFAYVIGMLIIFAVLAYVFLAGAIMIIIRFVVLNIYMVFSPLMFLGWVFPSMQGHSTKYWKGFLGQAFFAPAFLFMLYLSYTVASTFPIQRDLGNMFNPGGGTPNDAPGLIPYFAMVIVFLCASMIVAKNMGATGGNMAVSVGKNISGRATGALRTVTGRAAGGATAGLAARVGRNTIGAGAYGLTQNKTFKSIAARAPFGKALYNATSGVADSSFDARKVAGVGKAMGIGEGKKGGFATRLKETKESDEKFQKALGTIDKENDAQIIRLREQVDKRQKEISSAPASQVAFLQIKLAEEEKALKAARTAFGPAQEYANQLAYIKASENWLSTKKKISALGVAAAGVGASIVTGGILAGAGAAAVGALSSSGALYHTKNDVKAMRKSYGEDGSKMKKKKSEEENLKKMIDLMKEGEKKEEKKKEDKDDH